MRVVGILEKCELDPWAVVDSRCGEKGLIMVVLHYGLCVFLVVGGALLDDQECFPFRVLTPV